MKKRALNLLRTSLVWTLVIGFSLAWGYSVSFADEGDGGSGTLKKIVISGPSSVSGGATYTVQATFSNGSSKALGSEVTWSLGSTAYASIDNNGVLTPAQSQGKHKVVVKARYSSDGVTKTAKKTVTVLGESAATLSSISINGAGSVNGGTSSTYTATATFSNGTTRTLSSGVSWSLSSTSYATITSGGLLTAKQVSSNQSVTVRARYSSGGISKSASKSVTIVNGAAATLSSISINGASSVNEGTSSTYTATATFSNGTTQTLSSGVTWSLGSTSYAAITSGGVLTANQVSSNQSVSVNASYTSGGVTRTASKSVTIVNVATAPTLSSLAVGGASSVNMGATSSYTATATMSDGSTQNVTSSATWSLSSTAYASISAGVLTAKTVTSNQSVTINASYTAGGVTKTAAMSITIVYVPTSVTLSSLAVSGASSVASGGTASYTATATMSNGTTQNVTSSATWSLSSTTYATISTGGVLTAKTVTANQSVTVNASYTSGGVTKTASTAVTITTGTVSGTKSITSTSQNRATLPSAPVAEQAFTTQSTFQIFGANDLGMHCGDLDHRVASILPPFNVLHSVVIQKGTSAAVPEILTSADVDVIYSAASNPNDPALANAPSAPIFKTNFWDTNTMMGSGMSLGFDGYNPFYPPNILNMFPFTADMSLPAPDLAQLYPVSGTGVLTASQQNMPGVSAPYSANVPQSFTRFDTDFPFFVNFPFGYRQTPMNWFAADGLPMTPFDDFGRPNSFPLMRLQAKTKNTTLTGTAGQVFSSVDVVTPVSAEASCYHCHTSSADGGNGQAACFPGIDANCNTEGSLRSGTAFIVARASDDTGSVPAAAKKEWAADNNIIRLHDAKLGTHLQASQPVVCQKCHYTPALDLAHVGPLGPSDASANGRDQKVHHSNSRTLHEYHSQFTDLFPDTLPVATDAQRLDPTTGKPTVNAFVTNALNQTCYQCHPGAVTKCLRGAMFNGGLVCQDCHGTMAQVGNDFSGNFSASTPYPAGADLTKRVPWANVPACQSCHTGDAVSNLGLTDPNVVKSTDGIRLLRAFRTNDTTATPIVATNTRFAEETNGSHRVLYRLSKGHSGIFCEACHGSTHAEWPVAAASGTYVANDNMAATQIQGHTGKIVECTSCHAAGSLPVSLGGPHGMHPVGDSNFVSNHDNLVSANRAQCQACHGLTGQGTVLSVVAQNRTIGSRTLTKGQVITCSTCHSNQL